MHSSLFKIDVMVTVGNVSATSIAGMVEGDYFQLTSVEIWFGINLFGSSFIRKTCSLHHVAYTYKQILCTSINLIISCLILSIRLKLKRESVALYSLQSR